MKPLEEILFNINDSVDRYQTLLLKNVSEQSDILRDLTTALSQLEVHRADYYDQWLNVYFTCKHTSDAARCKWADNEVKELQLAQLKELNISNIRFNEMIEEAKKQNKHLASITEKEIE